MPTNGQRDLHSASLPPDAVLISVNLHVPHTAIVSGVGGRRAYLEYVPVIVTMWIDPRDSDEARNLTAIELWEARHQCCLQKFAARQRHPCDHVFGNAVAPKRSRALTLVWRSPKSRVLILQVER